jgi:DNA-binding PadR family transcriptional regulator
MPTEFAVLGLLLDGPKHGYELARHFSPETPLGEICHLEISNLYAVLKKQEQAGNIEAELEHQGARPPKRTFHLTDQGRAVFMEWVREPVDRNREVRLDFLIKLYFARQLGPDDVSALIGQQLEICRSTLDNLHTTLENRENKESQPANNFSYANDDEEDYGNKPKRSHPRPHEHERNRDLTPEEELFFRLVLEMRIKQNEAIIAWLESSRRELAGGYNY